MFHIMTRISFRIDETDFFSPYTCDSISLVAISQNLT